MWDSVDFPLFELHVRRLRPARQMAHMKFVHDQQPLGVRRLQQSKIKDEKESLTQEDVHPFWYCLVEGIEHWTTAQESTYAPNLNSSYSPHLRESIRMAVTSQNAIG